MIPVNDNERVVDRPCEICGQTFDSGTFWIRDGWPVEVKCAGCDDRGDHHDDRDTDGDRDGDDRDGRYIDLPKSILTIEPDHHDDAL